MRSTMSFGRRGFVVLLVMATGLALAVAAGAQDPTVTSETPPELTATVGQVVTETETETETQTETETEESSQRVDLESWQWALLAAGATAVVLIAFLLGRGTRREKRESAEKTPAARNQMLLAALSGWLAEGWTIESQSSTEAVVRKGTERRLLTVDVHGALNRSELPAVEADPTWVAPAGEGEQPPADEPSEHET